MFSSLAVPSTCPAQRFTTVAHGQQRSPAEAADLRHRRMASSPTALPKLAVVVLLRALGHKRSTTPHIHGHEGTPKPARPRASGPSCPPPWSPPPCPCSSPGAELAGKVDEVARHQIHVVVRVQVAGLPGAVLGRPQRRCPLGNGSWVRPPLLRRDRARTGDGHRGIQRLDRSYPPVVRRARVGLLPSRSGRITMYAAAIHRPSPTTPASEGARPPVRTGCSPRAGPLAPSAAATLAI
jgi:hypothetical protein